MTTTAGYIRMLIVISGRDIHRLSVMNHEADYNKMAYPISLSNPWVDK